MLDHELIWNQSMPATLPAEADIPIAWYGTSNTGMLKHVYRRGLAERYGKTMQCIAGVHYNFAARSAVVGARHPARHRPGPAFARLHRPDPQLHALFLAADVPVRRRAGAGA